MTLSVKYRRIDITDENQSDPVTVRIAFSVHSTQADVLADKGSDEISRHEVRCTGTRANVAALMATLHIINQAEIPSAVLALLSPPLQNP